LNTIQLLLLIHIFVLGIPMIAAAAFLLAVTARIRTFLEKYDIQRTIFKGILVVGYLFIFIAIMHLLEEVLEWYNYEVLSLVVGALWHGATVIVILVVSYSFYAYLKTLRSAEKEGTTSASGVKNDALDQFCRVVSCQSSCLRSIEFVSLNKVSGLPTFPYRWSF
jgi:hypothetical protein